MTMKTPSTPEKLANLGAYRRRNIAIGQAALELAAQEEDLQLIMRCEGGSESVVAARFLQKLGDIAERIYEVNQGSLTHRGAALFMLHKNSLLREHTPLDMCAVGCPELTIEAARCFLDPERGFDPELTPMLDKATRRLDEIRP